MSLRLKKDSGGLLSFANVYSQTLAWCFLSWVSLLLDVSWLVDALLIISLEWGGSGAVASKERWKPWTHPSARNGLLGLDPLFFFSPKLPCGYWERQNAPSAWICAKPVGAWPYWRTSVVEGSPSNLKLSAMDRFLAESLCRVPCGVLRTKRKHGSRALLRTPMTRRRQCWGFLRHRHRTKTHSWSPGSHS